MLLQEHPARLRDVCKGRRVDVVRRALPDRTCQQDSRLDLHLAFTFIAIRSNVSSEEHHKNTPVFTMTQERCC